MNAKNNDTPTKAKVQGAVEFCQKMGIPFFKEDVFRTFGVTRRRGYEFLRNEPSSRQRREESDAPENRGRHAIISPKDIREMERILEEGVEGRAFTWKQLGFEIGLECSDRTIQRAMGTMEYHQCIACKRGWVNENTRKRRIEWASIMLAKYPEPIDWNRVRFSDEIHFGWGSQGKLKIIRKPGQRYCLNCIQESDESDERDKNQHHCWASAGHNFKSDIHFYEFGGGKLNQKAYIDFILEPIVKPWIEARQDFVLEEDGDIGHGPSKSNIVRTWKNNHGLEHFFNCPSSPDLSIIDNCWQPPKQHIQHWDDHTMKGLIYEGWATVSQTSINEKVASMPERLRSVLQNDGHMTGY